MRKRLVFFLGFGLSVFAFAGLGDIFLHEEQQKHHEKAEHHAHAEQPLVEPGPHIEAGVRIQKSVQMDA